MKKIVIFILLFFLTGCFGKVEIEDLSIVTAIGVDKGEEGFKITLQVIRAKTVSGKDQGLNSSNVLVYTEEAPSVNEALRKMSVFFRNQVFLGHFQLLVLGEDYARDGFKEAIEFFFESPKTRQRFYIAIVKGGKAEDLLKIQTPMLDTPAREINSTIENNAKYFGSSILIFADEAFAAPLTQEFEIAITGIEIKGDPEEGGDNKSLESIDLKTKITVCGIAAFKGDKLVGWLNQEESIGYNRIRGLLKSTVHTTHFPDGSITSIDTNKGINKKKVEIVDGLPVITIDYHVFGVIPSVSTHRFMTDAEVKYLEADIRKTIKETMEKALTKAKELNSDILYFGEIINDQHPKYWKKIIDNFDNIFPQIKVNINVKVTIVNQTY